MLGQFTFRHGSGSHLFVQGFRPFCKGAIVNLYVTELAILLNGRVGTDELLLHCGGNRTWNLMPWT